MILVRPSVKEDVDEIYSRLSEEYKEELINGWGGYGLTAQGLVNYCYVASQESYTVMAEKDVLAIFGINGNGIVFFIGAHDIERAAYSICRHGGKYINDWLEKHDHIKAFINKKYRKFVRWLIHQDFTIDEARDDYYIVTKESWRECLS